MSLLGAHEQIVYSLGKVTKEEADVLAIQIFTP